MACCSSNQVSCQESNTEESEPTENHQDKDKTEGLLKKLKSLVPNEDLRNSLQQVAEDYRQNPRMPVTNLNELIKAIITTVGQKNTQPQGKGNSSVSHCSSNKKAKVYVDVAAKTFGADEQILKRINVETSPEPADCDVVLGFCPVTSRAASDVDDAMKNISGRANGKRVVLVVMHHSKEDIPLSQSQQNPGHQNVIKYVRVFYHETKKGLIKCSKNDKAIDELKELFKNLATQK